VQAKPYLSDGIVQGLVDPRLGDGYDAGQLRRLTFVASLCVRAAAAWRPTMTQVRAETDDFLCTCCVLSMQTYATTYTSEFTKFNLQFTKKGEKAHCNLSFRKENCNRSTASV
jgi:hypothetical protein